jgi:hypothetical protein
VIDLRRNAGNADYKFYNISMYKPVPKFAPEKTKNDRWFVAVVTGNGPDSHIGDFASKTDAENWIRTKSQYWPTGPGSLVSLL